MRLDPLETCHTLTGAVRAITPSLLSETYLSPRATWDADRLSALADAPWSGSLLAAPQATRSALESGLVRVMRATRRVDPEEIDVEAMPEGRARTHLGALRAVWRELDGALPEDLAPVAHALHCEAGDALEPLPLLDPGACHFADPIETALAERLATHHGVAGEEIRRARAARRPSLTGEASGALGRLQRGLADGDAATVAMDASVQVFGQRGPVEEADFAAAMIARMLDDGTVDRPRDIGLLAPADGPWLRRLAERLSEAGIPLSGAPETPAGRDAAGEAMTALLHVLRSPGAAVALAGLLTSPLMPWPREIGDRMAREVMERGWSRTASQLDGPAGELLRQLHRPAESPAQLMAKLGAVADALPSGEAADVFRQRLNGLRPLATGEDLDWPALLARAEPRPSGPGAAQRTVEGVTLFSETAPPWRPVRRLLVLGLGGRIWPRPAPADPFFTETEIETINARAGIRLASRGQALARQTELFRRHLCAVSEGVVLTAPARDARGAALPPAPVLSLIARALGEKSAEAMIHELDPHDASAWPCAHRAVAPLPDAGAPAPAGAEAVELRRDLLALRLDQDGRPATQSPSRLETLLVSPLGWLLDEIGAKDRTWAAPELGPLEQGSLLHGVLELAFPAEEPTPDDAALAAGLDGWFDAAVEDVAPWLDDPIWASERAGCRREAERTCLAWARFLRGAGAETVGIEMALAGTRNGLAIAGRADALLRLPDGRVLVVDHKGSSSGRRRMRMQAGWDLQVALYRTMLAAPAPTAEAAASLVAGAEVAVAYHTTRDGAVLTDARAPIPGAETLGADIAAEALARLDARLEEVAAGRISLGDGAEAKALEKVGITPYALRDVPLVAAFLRPDTAADEELA